VIDEPFCATFIQGSSPLLTDADPDIPILKQAKAEYAKFAMVSLQIPHAKQ
jgi:hypothetical protein